LKLEGKKVGLAVCGSFCTFETTLSCAEVIVQQGAQLTGIISNAVDTTDTRFMAAEDFKQSLYEISEKPLIRTISEAEPIGPQKLLDLLVVLPATGNTLAKLAAGITDTPVCMAVKSHLRNNRPVLLAISTNDALGGGAKNIGHLLNAKNIFFVPFAQDDPSSKPKSMVFLTKQVIPAMEMALEYQQLQPILGR